MTMGRSSRMEVPSSIVSKQVDNDLVVLNVTSGTYYKLNQTASVLWKHLAAGLSLGDAVERIQTEFSVSPEAAFGDARSLIEEWAHEGMVKVIDQ